jgi:hypothetical protein
MAIYKYSMKPDVSEDERRTTLQPGPFLVDASDDVMGRQLLSLNFGVAISRLIKAATALSVWGNAEASDCVTVADAADAEALQQRREVAGIDMAAWFLAQRELLTNDGRYARMLWWPLGPEDRCPV